MTSRRRRPRSTRSTSSRRRARASLTSHGLVAVVALAAWLLHTTGVTDADADASADGAPSSTTAPTITADTDERPCRRRDRRARSGDRPPPARRPAREGQGPRHRLRPRGPLRHRLARRRPQRLRHPERRARPRPHRRRTAGPVQGPARHSRLPVHRRARGLRAGQPDVDPRADRPRRRLENAWRTGAQQLSQEQREALANDPANLFAVDGHSNAQKRSGDAATWLPADTAFRCTYVEHQVTVKTAYRLWVAPAERDAMARVLDRC